MELSEVPFGSYRISRLICGSNPFLGYSYRSEAHNAWQRRHFTPERIAQILEVCAEYGVNAVAGIANPGRFFDLLRSARIIVNEYPFPDHHRFSEADFTEMDDDLPVLMTAKDAVKAHELGLKNAWCLEVDAVLPHAWEAELVARLREEKP